MTTRPPSVSIPGIVETIIDSPTPGDPNKAQIAIEGTDDQYREIRIENALKDKNGDEVSLKPGAHVHVIVNAKQPPQS
jgi:hypothetical protein